MQQKYLESISLMQQSCVWYYAGNIIMFIFLFQMSQKEIAN